VVGRHRPELQWGLLSMVARVDGSEELVASNPGLGVGLAWSFRIRPPVQRPLRSARRLVRRPRRAIAAWLGFPDAESSVRALSRLEPRGCCPWVLRHLASLLRDGERWVHHLPRLRPEALLLIEPPIRPWLTFGLLEEIAAEARASRRRRAAFDVRQVLAIAARLRPARRIPPLRSVAQVEQLVEELDAEERRQRLARWKAAGQFPAPPYPAQWMPAVFSGDRPVRIEPLVDAERLLGHARKQRNCLGSDEEYLERILQGSGYAYELSWEGTDDDPDAGRATLFLEARGQLHRHWGIDDLRRRFNAPSPPWLDARVGRFLARTPADRDPVGPAGEPGNANDRQLRLPFEMPTGCGALEAAGSVLGC